MTRIPAVLLGLATCLMSPVVAQKSATEPHRSWTGPVVHYGKWVGMVAAVTLTALAVREHNSSTESWNQLLDICRTDNADCAIGPDGTYIYSLAESYYQRSLYYDTRARTRLVFGQVAFLLATALFITDLNRDPGGPPNIPFDPNRLILGPSSNGGTKVGWRLEF